MKYAYEYTHRRNSKKKMLTLVHKCNVLTHCGDLWVRVHKEMGDAHYPEIRRAENGVESLPSGGARVNSKAFIMSVVGTFCLFGGQPACGMRSNMLPASEDALQTSPGATATQTDTGIATSIPTTTVTAVATSSNGFVVSAGGYVTSGPWQGYAWTGTESPSQGTVISPADFSGVTDGGRLCVTGTVGPVWEAVGLLGLNLNQSRSGPQDLWTPVGSGLAYDVTNNGGTPLRIQIQGAAGWPSEAWCAVITGTSGTVSWKQFNSSCWDNIGSFYDGTPLQSVMLLVPGDMGSSIPFSLCLNSITPI